MAVRTPVSSSRPTESNTFGRQSHAEQNVAYGIQVPISRYIGLHLKLVFCASCPVTDVTIA